ncbi:hypothetical protein FGO68_gene15019 [Halteria grandinella]|uniref:Uncharacterized protein n=1 Tax=Halteria grandinella TaxID=5974 RepID=A0A8J8SUG4_HALGN|nr:hypothetical protein FGO68_gene15019 [Halteria grandinella]
MQNLTRRFFRDFHRKRRISIIKESMINRKLTFQRKMYNYKVSQYAILHNIQKNERNWLSGQRVMDVQVKPEVTSLWPYLNLNQHHINKNQTRQQVQDLV